MFVRAHVQHDTQVLALRGTIASLEAEQVSAIGASEAVIALVYISLASRFVHHNERIYVRRKYACVRAYVRVTHCSCAYVCIIFCDRDCWHVRASSVTSSRNTQHRWIS